MPTPPTVSIPTYVGGGGARAGISGVTDLAEFLEGLLPDVPLDERRASRKGTAIADWLRFVSDDAAVGAEAVNDAITPPGFGHGEPMAPIEGTGPAQAATVADTDQGGAGVVAGWLIDPLKKTPGVA